MLGEGEDLKGAELESTRGEYVLAHNGWVMNADPLVNFANEGSQVLYYTHTLMHAYSSGIHVHICTRCYVQELGVLNHIKLQLLCDYGNNLCVCVCVCAGVLPEGADSLGRLCETEVWKWTGGLSMAMGTHEEIHSGIYNINLHL